jgi:lysozyme
VGFILGQLPIQPRVSRAGIELVKRFEGLRRKSARLADGGWTLGYGHTRSAREGVEVSPEEAEALLIYDLRKVAEAIVANVYTPLNQNQFDALAAFAFNIGVENFLRSAVLKRLNEGSYLQAASALELWRKADFAGEDIVVDALVRRRAAEKALFLTPPDGFRPTPTPVLRVLLDPSVLETLEQRRASLVNPVVLNAALEGDIATLERDEPPFALKAEDEPEQSQAGTGADEEPSPALAAAANVKARLDRLLADDEPARPDPSLDLSFPEPEPQAEPQPEPQSEPAPEPAAAPEPEAEAQPAAAPEPEPRPEPAPPETPSFIASSLFDPLRAPPEPEALADPEADDENAANGFGRRAAPLRYNAYPSSSPTPRRQRTPFGAPMLIVALVGIALFSGSIVAMLSGKATFAMLAIGLVGVICMAPAAIRFLLNQMEPEAVWPPSESLPHKGLIESPTCALLRS